ncbi:MAG: hypothetical protein DHS20C21_22230 [Gemmatimonadota bacterium]|nr:MAG: hypothetical protein DHS20C21_22230 [Gemmatimonadota bacterium]
MRPAALRILAVLSVSLIGSAAPARAVPSGGPQAQALMDADFQSGRMDRETHLLESFRYVFAPERMDARYAPAEYTPIKCLTPRIQEYYAHRDELTASARAELDAYLTPERGRMLATYVSPSGLFEFTYLTSGGNAVSSTDTNPANGIPDYVERCAEYMDLSWATEITAIGFTAPTLPGDGTYDVSFQSMGAYGFTTISGSTTEIVIHNTFAGFPNNSDPDGNVLGAAKVTCAHEFKHASNFTNNGWSGYEELDATWAEDIVFPATNDYWNYTNNNGPNILGQPWTPLDSGGAGSYEDCLWEHYLSNEHGNALIVEVYNELALGFNQNKSYSNAQITFGTSWEESYPGFLEYAWFTGSRAEPPFGFPDAVSLKRMNFRSGATSTYPASVSDAVDHLSGHPRRYNPGAATGSPRIQFDGLDSHPAGQFAVSVIMEEPDGTFTIVRPALDANNDVDYVAPMAFQDLLYVGVIVTNSKRTGSTVAYTLDVLDEPLSTDVTLSGQGDFGRLTMEANSPNPFVNRTNVRFHAPRDEHATVRILDVQGRVVRTLIDGAVRAGANELFWDGRDEAGRPLATGVYWARVQAGETSVARKVTLLR